MGGAVQLRLGLGARWPQGAGRAAIVGLAAFVVGNFASPWRPAHGDELTDYAIECDKAIGASVPDFDCDAGTDVPGQGTIFSGQARTVTCDEPNRLNKQCDPESRFQVLFNDNIRFVVAHCRKQGGLDGRARLDGMYGDIAVIQYNSQNGATCFYQALTVGSPYKSDMPGGKAAKVKGVTAVPTKPVKAPKSAGTDLWFNGAPDSARWYKPIETAKIGCGGCHDNGPFIRSPYINGVDDKNKSLPNNRLPGSDVESFNSTQPYAFVGEAFKTWKAWKVEFPPDKNTCNDCHRLGVSSISVDSKRVDRGTALDLAIRATSDQEVSESTAHTSQWMPPNMTVQPWGGQPVFKQTYNDQAMRIHDCAQSFRNSSASNLPDSKKIGDCTITLFASCFRPPPTAGLKDHCP